MHRKIIQPFEKIFIILVSFQSYKILMTRHCSSTFSFLIGQVTFDIVYVYMPNNVPYITFFKSFVFFTPLIEKSMNAELIDGVDLLVMYVSLQVSLIQRIPIFRNMLLHLYDFYSLNLKIILCTFRKIH